MLAIQKFLIEHPDNWRELLSTEPYNLKISEDDNLVLFKYNQISSDFNEEICRECRGIILEKGTWRVVRYAFRKFFNVDEVFADTIDWNTAVATEKIDGSIMTLFNYNREWHLATNGSINAYKAELAGVSPYKNFGELFDVAAKNAGLDYKLLNPNQNYTFELVSPFNKVVIDYPKPMIYLLSVRDMTTLEEFRGYYDLGSVPHPTEYNLNSEEEYRQCVADMPEGHEGIVVRDINGNRVKIKTVLYFQLHRAKNNGVFTLEKVIDLIRANNHHEFLSYFPEYTDYFNEVKQKIDNTETIVAKIKQDVAHWFNEHTIDAPRKWFAQDFGKFKYAALYYKEYDGTLETFISALNTPKFIKLFHLEEE